VGESARALRDLVRLASASQSASKTVFACLRPYELESTRIGIYTPVSTGRDDIGFAFWIVTDVILYPKVNKGQDLVWGGCRYDRVDGDSVVAAVRNSKQPWLRAAGWVYRVEDTSGNGRAFSQEIEHGVLFLTALRGSAAALLGPDHVAAGGSQALEWKSPVDRA
jgi:hypothetical protein